MSDSGMIADLGAVVNGGNRSYDGMGGGFWIFALIILFAMMGNGFGFGNRGGNAVTEADLCTANSFNEMKSQIGRMNDQMFANARTSDNAICTLGFQALEQSAATQTLINQCCCQIKQLIMEEGNTTRNMMKDDKIERMAAEIAELKADRRFCGVPRMPLEFTYSVNPYNLFGSNCCGNNSRNSLF